MASSSLIMGNNMHVKYLAGIVGAALLMAGCSSSNELSAAGQRYALWTSNRAECQLIGTATGKQSNWLSGQHGEEGGSMRGAANDLRNRAAAMGGNVIYGISSPSQECCPVLSRRIARLSVRFISARTDVIQRLDTSSLVVKQMRLFRLWCSFAGGLNT